MLRLYVVSAWMGTSLFYMPYTSYEACMAAIELLDRSVMHNVECIPGTAALKGSDYAPEISPIPVPRPFEGEFT